MTDEFKEIIKQDILRCKDTIEHGDKSTWADLHVELRSKYSPIIAGFGDNLYLISYDESGNARKANLGIMQRKLELFLAMDCKNISLNSAPGMVLNNTNQMVTTVNMTFESAKEQVENMSALKDEEIEEILTKLNQLEEITKSSTRKTKKWEMARDIIKWVADKGIDVAKIILPLVLKVGE